MLAAKTKDWFGMTKELLKINIGLQHPSTHGVLRLITELDGETVKSVEPVIGYLHRGMEKLAESRTYLQYLPMVDRVDYLSGFFCQEAFCSAVEKLSDIEVPERAKYIRCLLMELNRITSHLLWLGTYLMDLGASSPIFYAFREREMILRIFENLTGQRMMYNFHVFGGVKRDLSAEILDEIEKFLEIFPEKIKEYESILTDNPIFLSRTKGLGILTKNVALNYSITGANLRASGLNTDFRKQKPYLVYDKLDFDIPVEKTGDCYARYLVRIAEMKQAQKIVEQCVNYLKNNSGEFKNTSVNPLAIKPQGEASSFVEAPRGLMICTVTADGSEKPYRVKWRTGSFYSVQILPELLKDRNFADIMAIFGSLDVILSEVDR